MDYRYIGKYLPYMESKLRNMLKNIYIYTKDYILEYEEFSCVVNFEIKEHILAFKSFSNNKEDILKIRLKKTPNEIIITKTHVFICYDNTLKIFYHNGELVKSFKGDEIFSKNKIFLIKSNAPCIITESGQSIFVKYRIDIINFTNKGEIMYCEKTDFNIKKNKVFKEFDEKINIVSKSNNKENTINDVSYNRINNNNNNNISKIDTGNNNISKIDNNNLNETNTGNNNISKIDNNNISKRNTGNNNISKIDNNNLNETNTGNNNISKIDNNNISKIDNNNISKTNTGNNNLNETNSNNILNENVEKIDSSYHFGPFLNYIYNYLIVESLSVKKIYNKESQWILQINDIYVYKKTALIANINYAENFYIYEIDFEKNLILKCSATILLCDDSIFILYKDFIIKKYIGRGYFKILTYRFVVHNYLKECSYYDLVLTLSLFIDIKIFYSDKIEDFLFKLILFKIPIERFIEIIKKNECCKHKLDFSDVFSESSNSNLKLSTILCRIYRQVDDNGKALLDKYLNIKTLHADDLYYLIIYKLDYIDYFIKKCIEQKRLFYLKELIPFFKKIKKVKQLKLLFLKNNLLIFHYKYFDHLCLLENEEILAEKYKYLLDHASD